MIKPKVSILVPIYNVSDFIERCAHSLFRQTFQDLEFIFVNDCTTDDSIDILYKVIAQYPLQQDKIKIIHHQTNRGLASSRNTALDNSSGDYISVVDSDDYIEVDMIKVLYHKAITENADIVVSDFYTENPDKTTYNHDSIDIKTENNFIELLKQENTYSCLWNKLIYRELYNRQDCRIPDGLNYAEDLYVMSRLFYFAKKIVKVDQAFYHYVQYNTNAITKTKKNRMHFENIILYWNQLDLFLKDHNEFDKYCRLIELPKVNSKVRLMIDTDSYELRKEFANIFMEEEIKHISDLKKGEWLMLFLVRKKYFHLAQLFHNLLVFINKFTI